MNRTFVTLLLFWLVITPTKRGKEVYSRQLAGLGAYSRHVGLFNYIAYMKALSLLCITVFVASRAFSQEDCKKFHTGNFKLTAFGNEVSIERTKTKELVTNKMKNDNWVFVSDILWTNACTYQTSNCSVFKGNVPDEFKPRNNEVIICEIVEVSEKYYKVKCLSNLDCLRREKTPQYFYNTVYANPN